LLVACGGQQTPVALTAPSGVTATANNDGSITIAWAPVPGASAYTIERAATAGSEAPIGAAVSTTWVDNGVEPNSSYYYRVVADGPGGEVGPRSAEASATARAPAGTATFRGTMNGGQSFSPLDAESGPVTVKDAGGTYSLGVVIIGDRPGLCDAAAGGRELSATRYLSIALADVAGGSSSAPRAGGFEYTVGNYGAHVAWVGGRSLDAACNATATSTATSGTVHLTSVGPNGELAGQFDVQLIATDSTGNPTYGAQPEHATGSFTPKSCAALSVYTEAGVPLCK
jgi:hypothetical protein